MFGKNTGVRLEWREGQETTHVDGPEEESTYAMVLHMRFFFQKNEPINLETVALLYERLPTSHRHKRNFLNVCESLKTWKGSHPPMQLMTQTVVNGETTHEENLTNWRILELLIYGEYAHNTARHLPVLNSIRNHPFGAAILETLFQSAAAQFLRRVFAMQRENACFYEELTGERLKIEPLQTLKPKYSFLASPKTSVQAFSPLPSSA